MTVPTPFDVSGPLPCGPVTTVLEASAGTGKTYTIAALVTRYVAEGIATLDQVLAVTFSRAATTELRQRVRERLVATERGLAVALLDAEATTGHDPGPDDPVTRCLAAVDRDEVERRQARLRSALAEFDAATIATTHEFCARMLDGLGVLGEREPDPVFVESLSDVVDEVAKDVYLRCYAVRPEEPPFGLEDAREIAAAVVNAPTAPLRPEDADGVPGERVRFAATVREEVERRKRAGKLYSYDDMLVRLRDSLCSVDHGEDACRRLRTRYPVVLVDEFQDTDPVQWQIVQTAFHHACTVVLIGDPKQAIYGFRGADVYSYLAAGAEADETATLATNWRSDAAVVTALDGLFAGVALGETDIVVREVSAFRDERRLLPGERSAPDSDDAPVRLRVLDRDLADPPRVGMVRPPILDDLVDEVATRLSDGSRLRLGGRERPVCPGDVAVLVRTNRRGEEVRAALSERQIPAVLIGSSSVFTSPAAGDWLTLLRALEQPRAALVREATLTPFWGWTFAELASADEDAITTATQALRRWARVLAGQGVAALLETMAGSRGLVRRLLSRSGGERQLTDLRHIGQLLHSTAVANRLGPSALVEWLRERIADAEQANQPDRTRRLETDAAAVQILTVHGSKGLEFPLVYVPDAWDRYSSGTDDGKTLQLHDGPERVLDVGGSAGPGRRERFVRYREEDGGESLRLLYVALTRAQCQVTFWWAPTPANTTYSALHRLLARAPVPGGLPEPCYPLDHGPTGSAAGRLAAIPGLVVQAVPPDRTPPSWRPATDASPDLGVRTFTRRLDLGWRRTSYSALTAAAHGLAPEAVGVGSEPEIAKEDDEVALVPAAVPDAATVSDPAAVSDGVIDTTWLVPSPMSQLPSGTAFGTVVHGVLERLKPGAADLDLAALRASVLSAAAEEIRRSGSGLQPEPLAEALLPCLLTPLGPLADDRRLVDFPATDRLAELGFELPLTGGDRPTAQLVLGDVAALLDRHLPPGGLLAGYGDRLRLPALAAQPLRGFLTGSIDAVLRVPGPDPRFLVVDYKTNRLGPVDGPLTLERYGPARLADAMLDAHYPLQALLYAVAVHRFLRWRLPGYHPDVHLGGVLYLFLRGMAGPDTPRTDGVPAGVFSWRPATALVTDLSDLLDRGPLHRGLVDTVRGRP